MGRALKRLSLTAWIFIAMVLGVALGAAYPDVAKADWMAALANVFLRLIKSIIAPVIFGTLVYGIAGTGSVKTMGRIGLKALVYFEVLTTIALFLGLAAVNLVRPGAGLTLEASAASAGVPQAPPTFSGVLEHTFPQSVIDAMARGDVLQIVVFSFLFGAACAAIGAKAKPVVGFCQSLADVMLRYTKYVMYLAPVGVGAAMAHAIGTNGAGVLLGLGKLVLTLYVALVLFIVIFLGASAMLARIPMRPFLRAVREPCLIAFSTASSEAALPLALENMEQIGAPPHIVAFVLPTGYSFNLMGSALYLSLASVFIAQAAANPHADRPAASHDADVDAHQQRRGGGAACGHRGAGRNGCIFRSAGLWCCAVAGRRCRNGHGADCCERARQLHGDGRRRALGRRQGGNG